MKDSEVESAEETILSRVTAQAGYVACGWSLAFVVPHVYWAVGGTAWLAGHPMKGVLLAVNIIAIPLLFIAGIVALATTQSWGQSIPHRMLALAVWGVGAVLTVRGTVGIIQQMLSRGRTGPQSTLTLFADPWFLLGGVLFSITAWNYRKSRDRL
ncbi:DUF3995 domain-containing protein [Halocatena marina]|uniref:DUF3995 domain-containing protein n=1 Tax=Halocatena marina TaxID=2934937 RepID=A0ABD5YPD6_9EURY|nr:DUF3995 domain-containing protein [Halocatena marina]